MRTQKSAEEILIGSSENEQCLFRACAQNERKTVRCNSTFSEKTQANSCQIYILQGA